MDALYFLIPLSAALVLFVLGVFGWALHRGQFEDLEREGERIMQYDADSVDVGQRDEAKPSEQSPTV